MAASVAIAEDIGEAHRHGLRARDSLDGIFLSDFEQGEIGPDLFRHACLMGLEGMVSMRREIAPIVAAKVKNPASRAMNRAAEIDWSR